MRRASSWGLLLIAVAGLFLAGCQKLVPDRGQAFHGEHATFGKSFRPPAKKHEKFFFNEKSQQIEESLGM
ncbi:MAG: hypothetical protein ACYC0X_25905 [Pirellulaceae bacterium]